MSKYANPSNPHDDDTLSSLTHFDTRSNDVVRPFPERSAPVVAGPSNMQVLIWSLLGIGALGYLGVSTFAPDFIRAEPAETVTASSQATQARVESIADEVAQLRRTVDDQVRETSRIADQMAQGSSAVTELQRQIAGMVSTTRNLDERIATLETTRAGGKQNSRTAAEPVRPATAQEVASVAPATEGARIDGEVVDTANTVKTKPVADAGAPTPLVPKTAEVQQRKFGVQLGESESPEALRLNWSVLSEQYSSALRGLSARVAGKGPKYRLVAGPFASAKQAGAACERLAALGIVCKPGEFGGEVVP